MIGKPDFVEKKVILVFTKNGDKISFKNDNLIISNGEGKIKFQISCYKIFAVFIIGGLNITTGIIERSKRFGFSIVLFTMGFKVYETINYAMEGNTLLRKKQYETDKSINIAKQLVINKIENQRDMLKKIRKVEMLDGILNLDVELEKLTKNDYTLYEIMGIEGTTAKVYFNRIFKDYGWKGRQPRVKRDEINLLLDIGYTVLFNYLEGILNIYGFDIYKGNLHREFYKRKSLVCDVIEPFRPIVDYKIRKSYNLGQLKNYKYIIDNGRYGLNWKDTESFVTLILEEIISYRECIFDFIQSYYRWFMKDKDIGEFPKVRLIYDTD